MKTNISIHEEINPLGSLEDSGNGTQLKNDQESPGADKVYGTTATGQKGWIDAPSSGGGNTYINETKLYKAFLDADSNVNTLGYSTVKYKAATTGTYDNTVFTPVANGVQLLRDLENVTITGTTFMDDDTGTRLDVAISITINGVPSSVEGTHYLRGINSADEDSNIIIETFPTLSAGDVITVSKRRLAAASAITFMIEDKGHLSVLGSVPSTGAALSGFPAPIITSLTEI